MAVLGGKVLVPPVVTRNDGHSGGGKVLIPMVTLLPETVEGNKPESELALLRVLDASLDDSWLCFHGIKYEVPRKLQRSYGKSGEIDLLVVHRDFGFISIETKGGTYVWDQRGLRTPAGKEIKPTPRDQNFRTRDTIIEFAGGEAYLPFTLLACFPDMDPVRPFGTTGYEESVLWRPHLESSDRLKAHLIRQVDRPWRETGAAKDRVINAVSEWLCPSGRVPTISQQVRYVNSQLEGATANAVQLFEGQLKVAQIQNEAVRSVTAGAAGTGKSLLAVERARRLARLGNKVLIFTPNSRQHSEVVEVLGAEGLLVDGNRLKATYPGRVYVRTLDMVTRNVTELHSASLALADEVLSWDVTFDALIVDESQDLHEDLFSALQLRLDPTSSEPQIHMFGDTHQAAGLPQAWQAPPDFTPLYLSLACRSADPIQSLVNLFIPTGVDSAEGDGPPVRTVAVGAADVVSAAVTEVKYLIHNQGLKSDQIQILVATEPDPAWAHSVTSEFRKAVLGMRPAPRLPLSPDTFKGCEADVVVLVCGATELTDAVRREMYVGVSRAKAQLSVLASEAILSAIKRQPI